MMLCYKAWLESRTRFLLGGAAIAGLVALFVLMNQDVRMELSGRKAIYSQYIWSSVYKGYLRNVFVVLVMLFGMGGLRRERAHGTAGFTLALPVSRWRLIATRAGVGIAESTILAFVPATLLPLLSPLINETYPWSQSLRYGVLWTVGGALWFAIGFLASAVCDGEYSAPIAAVAVLFVYSIGVELPGIERYVVDVHDLMQGTGPHGFPTLTAVSASAFILIALAGQTTKSKDF